MSTRKPHILALLGWFLPGFKAGGPIRTLANLVERLSSHFRFTVLTRDRDLGDSGPYSDVADVRGTSISNIEYLLDEPGLSRRVVRALRRTDYDILYCNSLFSVPFSIAPLWAMRIGILARKPTVVAPRGELSPAALTRGWQKKRWLLAIHRGAGVYRRVLWHATDETEAARIRAWFGESASIEVIPNLATQLVCTSRDHAAKKPGELRLLFVGRVARMKNLVGALEILRNHREHITYDVYGPLEDERYVARCRGLIAELPKSITVNMLGPVRHELVPSLMREYDLLFLPTLGENFGHVIVEALTVGLPVLISDRTPWKQLEQRSAGWDLPLEDRSRFSDVISACAGMDEAEFAPLRAGALAFGMTITHDEEVVRRYERLFARALSFARSTPLSTISHDTSL